MLTIPTDIINPGKNLQNNNGFCISSHFCQCLEIRHVILLLSVVSEKIKLIIIISIIISC